MILASVTSWLHYFLNIWPLHNHENLPDGIPAKFTKVYSVFCQSPSKIPKEFKHFPAKRRNFVKFGHTSVSCYNLMRMTNVSNSFLTSFSFFLPHLPSTIHRRVCNTYNNLHVYDIFHPCTSTHPFTIHTHKILHLPHSMQKLSYVHISLHIYSLLTHSQTYSICLPTYLIFK